MTIPYIPETRKYWLVRTKGGRFYEEFRRRGEIGINWNEITPELINNTDEAEIKRLISNYYPKSKNKGRIANQLRIFAKQIKANDVVVITGPASNKFSVGKVLEDKVYEIERSEEAAEANKKYCPYTKRKRVEWVKELTKWEVEMPMFKLLQHAQHTISEANSYKDNIESLVHDIYVREHYAQINLRVKKEGNIPPKEFFAVGNELIKFVEDFTSYTNNKYNTEITSTEININSPGKIKLAGAVVGITVLGILLVSLAGGNIEVNFPKVIGGGGIQLEINGLIEEFNKFRNSEHQRNQTDLILNHYISELEIDTPEELKQIMNSHNNDN